MKQKEFSQLTDKELLEEAKKMKSASVLHAFLIGLMIGVIIYGVAKNGFGFFILLPLFLIFRVFHKPEHNKALKAILKERNLK